MNIPHNIEAERALLHQLIFEAIESIHREGRNPDMISVSEWLASSRHNRKARKDSLVEDPLAHHHSQRCHQHRAAADGRQPRPLTPTPRVADRLLSDRRHRWTSRGRSDRDSGRHRTGQVVARYRPGNAKPAQRREGGLLHARDGTRRPDPS